MDETVRNGYERIRVGIRVKAEGATDEQLDRLVQVARDRSPVFDTLARGTAIEVNRETWTYVRASEAGPNSRRNPRRDPGFRMQR